ncbi:hypothetical protein [Otariodibacter oris]|uniref:Uncharacterized protein n=1 Tax=Otariodibacter oris TaxID=1032623 RepID=A0A420XJ59_9PAST|nr:hypothetical protein [Otariodibacter oris]QGM80708.1 hypothetical protein A6A10_04460 [Otariodibacter oris]RKR77130.1 hypothetical protein DES31_0452 [Otariodibacter oris]
MSCEIETQLTDEEINQLPISITRELVFPHFSIEYDTEKDMFFSIYRLDKTRYFTDDYWLENLDALLDVISFKQATSDVPLLVTSADLGLIYQLRPQKTIIDLDTKNRVYQ